MRRVNEYGFSQIELRSRDALIKVSAIYCIFSKRYGGRCKVCYETFVPGTEKSFSSPYFFPVESKTKLATVLVMWALWPWEHENMLWPREALIKNFTCFSWIISMMSETKQHFRKFFPISFSIYPQTPEACLWPVSNCPPPPSLFSIFSLPFISVS